ncbi:hypothetical protein J3458_000289 [Metarhizium acridum]|uniref:uncharacterized protein n=1 Tax=Metarhizium acridum TaxID=92637 RepID=UPI001C6B9A3D|nr:hypothetical protein J3458_000289 [Metarhizium acridum]
MVATMTSLVNSSTLQKTKYMQRSTMWTQTHKIVIQFRICCIIAARSAGASQSGGGGGGGNPSLAMFLGECATCLPAVRISSQTPMSLGKVTRKRNAASPPWLQE